MYMDLFFATLFISTIISSMTGSVELSDYQSKVQSQTPLFSFGIVADVQYANSDPAGTRFYRASPEKLREAMNSFSLDSVDFIFNLGDLIDKDFESYKPVMNILDSSHLKVYHTTGNHDYAVEPRQKKRIPQLDKSKEGYYSFVHKGFRFIILNGNEISTYSTTSKSVIAEAGKMITALRDSGELNAMDWNGGVSTKQLQWLDEQLNTSETNKEKAFIICHFPVVPENAHNLLNYRNVINTLQKHHNVIAWLNGHNHAGNYGNVNFTHFVTFKGMVETENTNSYAMVDVYKNKIWIRGSGREKSMILAY
jgi:manganese-dependent ADP-ribose/CDP-alcohol diphosphatase